MTLELSGAATGDAVEALLPYVQRAIEDNRRIVFDLDAVDYADGRFFGLIIETKKQLARRDLSLTITGVSPCLRRLFRLNRFEFLLSGG